LDDGWETASQDLKKLRLVPPSIEAKVQIIQGKVYGAAMYGIEAAEATPTTIAKLTAAVVAVFRSRNNSHNVDRFFTTLTHDRMISTLSPKSW